MHLSTEMCINLRSSFKLLAKDKNKQATELRKHTEVKQSKNGKNIKTELVMKEHGGKPTRITEDQRRHTANRQGELED